MPAEPLVTHASYAGSASALALESEPALPPRIHESLQMIRRNVELEARLIDDLLDLTRIDRGKVQLNFEIVDAHSLLQNALEICQPEIDRKHLTCSVNLSARKVHLRADPARLQQIFWNLINNAVKFTPSEGRFSFPRATTRRDTSMLGSQIADWELSRNHCQKFSMPLNKAAAHSWADWVWVWLSARRLWKPTTEQSPHKARVETKAPDLHSSLQRAKQRQLKLLPLFPPGNRNARVCGFSVEDHEDTNRSLTNLLRRRGYQVQSALNFESAWI